MKLPLQSSKLSTLRYISHLYLYLVSLCVAGHIFPLKPTICIHDSFMALLGPELLSLSQSIWFIIIFIMQAKSSLNDQAILPCCLFHVEFTNLKCTSHVCGQALGLYLQLVMEEAKDTS